MTTEVPTAARQLRRVLKFAGISVVALGMLAALLVWLTFGSTWGRRQLLAGVADAAAKQGIALAVEDFRLSLHRSCLELRGLKVGAKGATPFFEAEELVACVELATLRQPVLHVRELRVERWQLHPEAPLTLPSSAPASTATSRRFVVDRISLHHGAVGRTAVAIPTGSWTIAATHVDVEGSLRNDRAHLQVRAGELTWERAAAPVWRGQLELTLEAGGDGSLAVESLRLQGPGLELQAALAGALQPATKLEGRLSAEVDAATLVPEHASGGHLHIELAGRYPELTGSLLLAAEDIRIDDLAPYLPAPILEKLSASGTCLDIQAEASVGPAGLLHPTGTATIRWRRRDTLLATGEFRLAHTPHLSAEATHLRFQLAVLPGFEGELGAQGELQAASLAAVASGQLAPATLVVRAPDIVAAQHELVRAFPALQPLLPRLAAVTGSLDATITLRGRLDDLQGEARATWIPNSGGKIELEAVGQPLQRAGHARLTFDAVPLAVLQPGAAGTFEGRLEVESSEAAYRATASLTGTGLAFDHTSPPIERLRVEAFTDGHTATVDTLEAWLGKRHVRAKGNVTLQMPLEKASLHLEMDEPVAGVAYATAELALTDGVLHAEVPFADTAAGALAARLELPLGTLARLPELAKVLQDLPLQRAQGPLHLQLWMPHLDSCGVVAAAGASDRPEQLRANLTADLWLDPEDLAGVEGQLQLADLQLSTGSDVLAVKGPALLKVENRRVALEPLVLQARGAEFEASGEGTLAVGWQAGVDSPAQVVEHLALRARGTFPATLLTPYLAGGVGRGTLAGELEVSGSLADLRAAAHIDGSGLTVYWPTPYATRLSDLRAELSLARGELRILDGHMRVNGGEVTFSGQRWADGFISAHARLAHLAYGLDYGIKARLSGELDLAWDPPSHGLLAGTVVLERAVLDRDLDLEREVLPRFLAPVQTAGTTDSLLDAIELDLRVETVEGLRVRNNVANVRAVWEPLEVGGTLWNPILRGQVEIDPGGCVSAYNQRFRLDRAVATFTGDPVNDPQLDLSLTSSLEDDTICRDPGDPLTWETEKGMATGTMEGLATGLAGYFGERLVGKVGEDVGLGHITIRPVYVFGETDPSARLTITRDISRYAALAVSLDLRNTQRQTYILDLHGFRKLPRFVVQGFSNDEGHAGGSVQQVLELGASRTNRRPGPELERVVVVAPSKRLAKLVRQAVRLSTGEPLPEDALLDAEIEALHALRQAGFPEATVSASLRPAPKHPERLQLELTVEPGRQVRVLFTGDRPPAVSRRLIASLYRLDDYEPTSRQDMHNATVRALRSLGFCKPQVSVTVAPGDPIEVRVHSLGGTRVQLEKVLFMGLPAEEAALLAKRFAGPTERTELAAKTKEAFQRVEQSLRALGYPNGRVAKVELDSRGKALLVEIEAGPQKRLASIELVGLAEADTAHLLELLPVHVGDPVRLDRIGAAVALLKQELAARGFGHAHVKAVPVQGAAGQTTLRFEVAAGSAQHIAGIHFAGQRSARESWLRRLAGLHEGEAFDPRQLARARARLLGSGRFSAVATVLEPSGNDVDVTFRLREAARFSIAYGVRWESEVGLSALVDVVDRSALGRGLEAAVRARWEPQDRSGRLLFKLPVLPEQHFSLEAFAERRRRIDSGFVTDSATGTLQLSQLLAADLTARIYVRYSDVHIYEQEPDPFFPFDVRIKHPYVGLQVIRDTREHPVLGVRGMLASLDLSGSGPWLGSDYSYVRAYGQLNLFRPFGTWTWASSLRAGAARAFGGQELLTDVRFKTGGEYSVRGYPFESLGPQSEIGDKRQATGGAAVLVLNQELRFSLPWFDMLGLVFFDAGQVWAQRRDFGRNLATSAGIGVRAPTPVGVVRLDLARPLNRRPSDPSFKVYVGLGSTF